MLQAIPYTDNYYVIDLTGYYRAYYNQTYYSGYGGFNI